MKKKKDKVNKKGSAGNVFASSMILTLLGRFSSAIYRKLASGFFAKLFTGYSGANTAVSDSLVAAGVGKLELDTRVAIPFKHTIARWVENSAVIRLIMRFLNALLAYPMKSYGLFLFSFSFYSTVVYLFKLFYLERGDTVRPDILYIAFLSVMLISSVLMITSRHCLGSALRTSPAARFFLFRVVGLRSNCLDHVNPGGNKYFWALCIGLLFGFSSFVIHPLIVIAAAMLAVFAYLILIKPEFGVWVILTLLPFLPTMVLIMAVLFVSGCYFIKVITGRRSLKFELLDGVILAFMLLMVSGGLVSVSKDSLKPMLVYVAFMLGYFLVVNLIRSREWIVKCIVGIVASGVIVALYGLYQNFFGSIATKWLDTSMFSDIEIRVVSTFENPNVLAEYLIMLLPLMIALILLAKTPRMGFAMILAAGLTCACIVYTWSRGAWLGIMFGMLIFFLILSKKTLTVMLLGLFAVPFIPFILPESVLQRFMSIGNMGDSSTSYRFNIWRGVADMLGDYWRGGIGIGYEPFRAVYPSYSLEAIEAAPHAHNLYLQIMVELGIVGLVVFVAVMFVFAQSNMTLIAGENRREKLIPAALFCGITAVLTQGMTDHIWYNYRVFLMFWLLIGLCAAVRRVLSASAEDEIY